MTQFTPEEVLQSLLDHVSTGQWAAASDLYAEDAVVEHPNATEATPVPRWLRGRSELRDHFMSIGRLGFDVEARNVRFHRTDEDDVIVLEFEYHGQSSVSPAPFVMANIFVARVRDGLIVESRDYQGPPRRV